MCTVRFRSLCCCCSCLFCTLYIMCLLKLINLHITPTAYHNKRLNRQNVWIGCTLTLRGMPAKRSSFYLQRWGQKRNNFHWIWWARSSRIDHVVYRHEAWDVVDVPVFIVPLQWKRTASLQVCYFCIRVFRQGSTVTEQHLLMLQKINLSNVELTSS